MASTPIVEEENKARDEETKQRIDAVAELRKTVARLEARSVALHRDIVALSQFVRNTQAVHTELMSRLCDQVFRISDILHLLPVVQANVDADAPLHNNEEVEDDDDEDNDNDQAEEEGGMPFDGVYRDHIL